MLGFLVQPELVEGNVGKTEMLTEVRELFIDMAADIAAIHDPYLEPASFLSHGYVGRR